MSPVSKIEGKTTMPPSRGQDIFEKSDHGNRGDSSPELEGYFALSPKSGAAQTHQNYFNKSRRDSLNTPRKRESEHR